MSERVSNGPLRDAFRASDRSAVAVCRDAEWWVAHRATERRRERQVPDTKRLRRSLGLEWHVGGRGHRVLHRTIDASDAERLCDALGVDFCELYPEVQVPAGWCECGEPLYEAASECGWCAAGIGVAA